MPPVTTALIIFIITYIFIGLRQIPRIHIDRPAGALVGAVITIITIAIGILVLIVGAKTAHAAGPSPVMGQEKQLMVTVTPSGSRDVRRQYKVVLRCETDAQRTVGLQGFRQLRTDEAALFVFEEPGPVTFWMGSVTFPIDIIHIAADGRVVRVYPNCAPGSRELYPSYVPVQWVIETAAGSGIRAGDRVVVK